MAQWKAALTLAAVAFLVVCSHAAAITAGYEEDALTPPLPFEPAPPGALDNEMRFRQTPITTVTTTTPTTTTSTSAPTPITTTAAPAPAPANVTAPPAPAPATAPAAPTKRQIGERPKPMIVYANAVRQSLGNADRALHRVSELYEAFLKSLNDQSILLKKQQAGFKNDSQIFKNALTDGAQRIKDIQNPLNDIPEVRAKLRATFRALGRNADGSIPPNSTNMAPSFVEVDETATIAAALEADAREAATVRSMAGASNILERVQEALEELFQQAEVKNQALQDNLDRAKSSALRHKDFIPGLLGEVDSRNRLNEKYLSLLQTQRNLKLAKFREMQPYFLEVLEVNTTASPNATHLQPNTSNITSLVTPISSDEPKDPVNPAVYWPSLLRFLTELNGTVIKKVMSAMDWHTKVTKAHQNLLSHYRKMIENYNLIMNEARAQLALIESACKSVKVVRNKFAEIDADPNVPQFVKDDYKSAYLMIAKIQHENGKKFKQFYAAKSNLLDLIKPMGDSYYVYRLVVVASRNLLTAELNQIVDGWRKAAAVTGGLYGTLKPHMKTLSQYTFKL